MPAVSLACGKPLLALIHMVPNCLYSISFPAGANEVLTLCLPKKLIQLIPLGSVGPQF